MSNDACDIRTNLVKLKDEVDYNETFVEAYAESEGEVSIELAPSVGKFKFNVFTGMNVVGKIVKL